MPWDIVSNDEGCPTSEPFGVRKRDDNELEGCHRTRNAAEEQVAALNASENRMQDIYIEDVEYRTENDGNTIIGYAALFDTAAEFGGGYERFASTAFDNVLTDNNTDVRALHNHDPNQLLGRQSSGTLKLSKDAKGIRFEITPPNTDYAANIRELINRGDLRGASFGFQPGGDILERATDGRQIRTHTNIRKLLDVSTATFPVYGNTTVSLRHIDITVERENHKETKMAIETQKSNVNPSPEDILAEMRSLVDTAEQENRSLTVDEIRTYENYERNLITKRNDELRSRHEGYLKPASVRSDVHVHTTVSKPDDEYNRAFDRYLRTGDVGILSEFRAQSAGVGSEGGFTVPEAFRQKLVDRLVDFGGLASVAEVITTAGGEAMRWPTLDDTANTGVIAAENTAPASGGADLVFGEKTLGAFRYVAPGTGNLPLRVSVELLQDSAFDVQSLVTRKLGERIARQQADHWTEGDGTGEPLGIAGPGPEVNGTYTLATQQFTTPPAMPTTHNELIDAMLQVNEAYHPNAVFVVSFNAWGQLRKLVDADNRPILQPDSTSSIGSAPGFNLEGHPIIIDSSFDNFAAPANPGVGNTANFTWGVFGDIRETYVVRRVRDLQLVVDPFTRANEGQVQFTMWARADGTIQNDFSAVLLQTETVGS